MNEDQAKKDFNKIVERAQKLHALSTNNPNENEALAAANRLHALLAQHNLSLDDIVGGDKPDIVADNDLLTWRAAWIKPLLHETAKLFFCGYFTTAFDAKWIKKHGLDKLSRKLIAGGKSRIYLKHSFVGTRANITIAKNVAEYLVSTAEALCREAEKTVAKEERISFRFSFMNACASRLCARLRERRLKTASEGVVTGTTNLPALRSLYEQADQDYEDWKAAQDVKVTTRKVIQKIYNQAGAFAGLKAGDTIGLETQVEGYAPVIQIGN